MDTIQLRRAGEAMEDLRLALVEQADRKNVNMHAWKVLEEARRALQEEIERLGQ